MNIHKAYQDSQQTGVQQVLPDQTLLSANTKLQGTVSTLMFFICIYIFFSYILFFKFSIISHDYIVAVNELFKLFIPIFSNKRSWKKTQKFNHALVYI